MGSLWLGGCGGDGDSGPEEVSAFVLQSCLENETVVSSVESSGNAVAGISTRGAAEAMAVETSGNDIDLGVDRSIDDAQWPGG